MVEKSIYTEQEAVNGSTYAYFQNEEITPLSESSSHNISQMLNIPFDTNVPPINQWMKATRKEVPDPVFRRFLMNHWPPLACSIWAFMGQMRLLSSRYRKEDKEMIVPAPNDSQEKLIIRRLLLEAHQNLKPGDFIELIQTQFFLISPTLEAFEAQIQAATRSIREEDIDDIIDWTHHCESLMAGFTFIQESKENPALHEPTNTAGSRHVELKIATEMVQWIQKLYELAIEKCVGLSRVHQCLVFMERIWYYSLTKPDSLHNCIHMKDFGEVTIKNSLEEIVYQGALEHIMLRF